MTGAKYYVTRCSFGLLAASLAGTSRDSCRKRATRRYERKRREKCSAGVYPCISVIFTTIIVIISSSSSMFMISISSITSNIIVSVSFPLQQHTYIYIYTYIQSTTYMCIYIHM